MNEDLINPTTKKWIEAYISRPSASLLIKSNGDNETGKKIIELIHKNLVSTKSPLINVVPEKNSITIDQIRSLQHTLSLVADRTKDKITRIAAINQSNLLTTEAQNALLKLIEELPSRTIVCLITDTSNSLIDTVTSRCFMIEILPISKKMALTYAETKNFNKESALKAYLLSEGNAGKFVDYLEDGFLEAETHVNLAKKFISAKGLERQMILSELYKNKDSTEGFMVSLELISKTAMRNAKDYKSKQNWKSIFIETSNARKLLNSNVSPKLALLELSLEL